MTIVLFVFSMDLYLKAGPDGKCVGDCPFAHTVRMVLHIKRVDCRVCTYNVMCVPCWSRPKVYVNIVIVFSASSLRPGC